MDLGKELDPYSSSELRIPLAPLLALSLFQFEQTMFQ
jgi:hypothetical protein